MGSKDIGIRNISFWTNCNFFRHSYLTEVIAWNIKSLQPQLAKIIICGEFLVFFCVFMFELNVTYKVSKKAALALDYKPQWKCLGLKIPKKVRQMLNIF